MATFEEELKKREPIIKGASSFALLGKKIEIMGKENFVKGGPNIIVGNHIGTFKTSSKDTYEKLWSLAGFSLQSPKVPCCQLCFSQRR
ncbi:hypothetical protein ES703_123843 [subsurface metagenome]